MSGNAVKAVSVALEGCVASSVAGPGDLFRTANLVSRMDVEAPRQTLPTFAWRVCGATRVKTHTGMTLVPDAGLAAIRDADVVLVPAIGAASRKGLARALRANAELIGPLKEAHGSGALVAGLCTGTFLLAEAGLLDGREATTSWWMSARFASAYPKVRLTRSKMLTLDNRLLCAGAGAASFDAALAIIEYFGGRWLAQTVARYFVLDNIRPSQAAYAIPAHLIASDRKIAEADRWIRANISRKITVAELAGHIGMSERTFHRRLVASTGLSPRHYVQTIRIEMAKTLALSTSLTHDQIAAATGYLDTNAFRRAFKSQLGMTVNAFRNRAPPRAGGLDKSAEVFQRPGAQDAGKGRLR